MVTSLQNYGPAYETVYLTIEASTVFYYNSYFHADCSVTVTVYKMLLHQLRNEDGVCHLNKSHSQAGVPLMLLTRFNKCHVQPYQNLRGHASRVDKCPVTTVVSAKMKIPIQETTQEGAPGTDEGE